MMNSKMMASGGVMKKGAASGGVKKKTDKGLPMVMKDGKKVPSFAADGVGKMKKGGMMKTKMMASGGSTQEVQVRGVGAARARTAKIS